MLPRAMLDMLLCPACQAEALIYDGTWAGETCDEGELACKGCGRKFAVRHGVPNLVVETEASSAEWQQWEEHLSGYAARDDVRRAHPSARQQQRWAEKRQAFTDFLGRCSGRLLDVGCGSGSLRRGFEEHEIEYFGTDPLVDSQASEFPFARALAESIPFRDRSFDTLVVRSALDHFCDLPAFFREASRVLCDDGHFYLEQVVFESNSPAGILKIMAHRGKDFLDGIKQRGVSDEAPKHIRAFSRAGVFDAVAPFFEIIAWRVYNRNLITPSQLFLCAQKRGAGILAGRRAEGPEFRCH